MNEATQPREVLKLDGVVRDFGRGHTQLHVLKGSNLTINAGEIVALVGPSGSGKSTLLQIAGLLERPDGGEVYISGEASSKQGDDRRTELRRKHLGFVYQYHHLLPEFSALENIVIRSEEHTSELQSHHDLVCRLLLEKKKFILQHPELLSHNRGSVVTNVSINCSYLNSRRAIKIR